MNRFNHNYVYQSIVVILIVLIGVFFHSCTNRDKSTIVLAKKERLFSRVLNEERTQDGTDI